MLLQVTDLIKSLIIKTAEHQSLFHALDMNLKEDSKDRTTTHLKRKL
jgi:hypothetical protein